jgi:molybdenum cofactor biosynthesis enzyme MoaA
MRTTSYLVSDALTARQNRNGAYDSAFEYLDRNHIPGEIWGQPWRFYWNVNLYVDLTAECNQTCPFCINRVNFTRHEISDREFLTRFEEALKGLRHLGPSIQIVGGEPLLEKYRSRLFSILALVKKYNIRKPIIGSNGSAFFDELLPLRLDPYLAHLNISRHHYLEERLRELFRHPQTLPNDRLAVLLDSGLAGRIRLNCALLQGYIDCHSEVVRYLDWALAQNCRNICFSTLSKLPSDYIYEEAQIARVKSLHCDFDRLMAGVSADPRFEFRKFHSGTHCMYEVWEYNTDGHSCTVVFATSDNHFTMKLDEIPDLIELLVFHTNGELTASWNRNVKKVLA